MNFNNFMEHVCIMFADFNPNLYKYPLQAEHFTCNGWLLYFHENPLFTYTQKIASGIHPKGILISNSYFLLGTHD